MIYDGFKAAVAGGVPKEKAGILVDEQFGAAILRDAAAQGFNTACPAEKSGQDEFDFEYGDDFAEHIEAFRPTFCKVLVRYNPEGDQVLNQRQIGPPEAAVRLPARQEPEPVHVRAAGAAGEGAARPSRGRQEGVRPGAAAALMVEAIEELQDAGVEPDVWKIEGLDRREDCDKIVAAARRGGRDKVGCIVLGRGEDDKKVHEWLTTRPACRDSSASPWGAPTSGSRSIDVAGQEITREAAVAEIARRYREFVRHLRETQPRKRPFRAASTARSDSGN